MLGEGDALRLARDLLTQAAVSGVATPADAQALADDLIDGWRFRSRLVQDWWRQGNELGFVPAARRRPRGDQ